MEDRLALNSEPRGFIGHQSLTLSSTDLGGRVSGEKSPQIEEVMYIPEPQRLVLPLLQNLHSRHSAV